MLAFVAGLEDWIIAALAEFNVAVPDDGKKAIIDRLAKRFGWLNGVLGMQHYLTGG